MCSACGEEAKVCEPCGHAVCRTCLIEAEGCSIEACDCLACLSRVEEACDSALSQSSILCAVITTVYVPKAFHREFSRSC